MPKRFLPFPPLRLFPVVALFLGAVPPVCSAYVTSGYTWPAYNTVTFQLGLGSAGRTLQDGNTSWDSAAAPALDEWEQRVARLRLDGVLNSSPPISSGDRVNSVVFSNSVFGQSFGRGTLAVTYYRMQGSSMIEADILFNRAASFDSYRGNLQFGSGGYAIADIRRVMLHELGHAIGLNHPDDRGQQVDAVMNSVTSNRAVLAQDDINGAQALYGAATPTPTPAPARAQVVNISTRVRVGTGDNVLIAGFIVSGSQSKRVILRGIGPSLASAGISSPLNDPELELRGPSGALIGSNNNWQQSSQVSEISASGVAPSHPYEAAIVATLAPGSYTAVLKGVNNAQGIALVEVYDLQTASAEMVNVSTRGVVGTGDGVMIAGVISTGSSARTMVVRGIGPSLSGFGVAGAMGDPMLELRDGSGNLIASNDDWADGPGQTQISGLGLAPTHSYEAAIYTSLNPGTYSAILRGYNNGTGVGLVEVYAVQ